MGSSRDDHGSASFERGAEPRRIDGGASSEFTAADAAKLVQQHNQAQTREMEAVLWKLLEAIYKDAKVGKTSMTYDDDEKHHETLASLLRQRGFKVEVTTDFFDGDYLTIRW